MILSLINGIGQHIADRLHNADILTFAQLAALSPEDIAEVLGNNPLHSAEHIEKQDWIGQARELASRIAPAPAADATIPNGRQRLATFTVELLLGKGGHVRRTHIVHIQDGREDTWAGWKDGALEGFMVEHAPLDLAWRRQVPPSEPETIPERSVDASVAKTAAEEPQAPLQLRSSRYQLLTFQPNNGELCKRPLRDCMLK